MDEIKRINGNTVEVNGEKRLLTLDINSNLYVGDYMATRDEEAEIFSLFNAQELSMLDERERGDNWTMGVGGVEGFLQINKEASVPGRGHCTVRPAKRRKNIGIFKDFQQFPELR
jgi:hypothetical protein